MTTINVRMGVHCEEYRKGGATDNGLCLRCMLKALDDKPMKSATGRAMQKRYKEQLAREPASNPVWLT